MVFIKILEPVWANEIADGQKMFECVANKGRWQNQFEQLASGDILIICIKGENKVSAVCEVASAARTKQTNREVLKSKLQECHHAALDAYLDKAASFDYVEFKQVFDCRFVFSQFLANHWHGCKHIGINGIHFLWPCQSNSSDMAGNF